MQATLQNILEAFNQLTDIEKHAIASEIIKQVAMWDIPQHPCPRSIPFKQHLFTT